MDGGGRISQWASSRPPRFRFELNRADYYLVWMLDDWYFFNSRITLQTQRRKHFVYLVHFVLELAASNLNFENYSSAAM